MNDRRILCGLAPLPSIDVSELGAVLDDPAEAEANSQALQLAVDLLSTGGGGVVYVDPGPCHLARPVEVRGDNIEIRGRRRIEPRGRPR